MSSKEEPDDRLYREPPGLVDHFFLKPRFMSHTLSYGNKTSINRKIIKKSTLHNFFSALDLLGR